MSDLELKIRIGAELKGIRQALSDLNRRLDTLGKEGARAGREAARGMQQMQRELGRTKEAARETARTLRRAFAAVGGALAVRDITRTAVQFDRIRTGLQFVAGSAEGAAQEMQFVRDVANGLGLELATTAEAWTQFASAAKGTALEGDGAREVFVALTKAASVMDLSVEQTQGALLALQQIMSKGTVQAEELRGQLGERLPGAFQIAARAMGVNTQQLGEMLQKGKVLASDFLPKFAAELERTFGDRVPAAARSAQSQLNRFSNALTELKLNFAESGFLEGVTTGLTTLARELSRPAVQSGLRTFGETVGSVLKFIATHPNEIKSVLASLTGLFVASKALRFIKLPKNLELAIKGIAALAPGLATYFSGLKEGADSASASVDQVDASLQKLSGSNGGLVIDIPTQGIDEAIKDFIDRANAARQALAAYAKLLQAQVAIGAKSAATAQAELSARSRELAQSLMQLLPRMEANARYLEEIGRSADAARLRSAMADITKMAADGARGALSGVRAGLNDYIKAASDTASQMKNAVAEAFQNMENALVRFVRTGKLSFRELVDSILADLARIAVRKGITQPLAEMLFKVFGSAQGNAFAGGQVLAFASGGAFANSVVTGPTLFPLGLMGEAGPEAILPLKRTRSGDLGVTAEGLNPKVEVHIHEEPGKGGQVEERADGNVRIIDVFVDQVRGALIQDVGRDGPFARALESQYGLNRAPGGYR